jgi:Skp family chaperone for outer membrane proteins
MRGLWIVAAVLLVAAPLAAQQADGLAPTGVVQSPILTIDPDRLFAETQFGRRVTADVNRAAAALDQENSRIETQLTAEEQSLTARRPEMAIEAFQVEAEGFDARVQTIRAEQDAKERALTQAVTDGRNRFLEAATPILVQIMIDSGAAVILDRRSVFLGVGAVDITDTAIAAIDAALGDGAAAPGPEDAPETAPGSPEPAAP